MTSWGTTRLRYVADVNPSIRGDLLDSPHTELSFLPMEAIGADGSLDLERIRPVSEVRNGYSYFETGDVAFAKVTPCFENGKGALMRDLVGGAGFGTTELTVLRPKTGTNGRFLHYAIQSERFRQLGTGAMTGAGGLKRVPDEFTRDFETPWPTPTEQDCIANFLDEQTARIDALIAEKERLLRVLAEMRDSLVTEAVTRGLNSAVAVKDSGSEWIGAIPDHWSRVRLGYLLWKVADGPHFSPEYVEDGYPFLSARNIKVDRWSLDDAKFIDEPNFLEFSKRIVPEHGDVLYTKGGTTGIARYVDLDMAFQVWVHVAVLKLKRDKVDGRFLAHALNSRGCYAQSQLYTYGATNNDFGLTRMVRVQLALPPLDEQRLIASYLDAKSNDFRATSDHVLEHITRLREYRSSLISAAVTGQIDVGSFRVPAAEEVAS